MIISHKHKFVFVHNPKAAGSSVRDVLAPYHDHFQKFWGHTFVPELDRVVDSAHLTLTEILTLVPQVADYTFLVVVRDPVSRLESSVKEHRKQHYNNPFVSNVSRAAILANLTSTNVRFDWRYIHFCPQHNYIHTLLSPPGFLDLKVFKVEDLDKLHRELCELTGDALPVFPTLNASSEPSLHVLAGASAFNEDNLNDIYHADLKLLKPYYSYETSWTFRNALSDDYENINCRVSPYTRVYVPYADGDPETVAYIQSHTQVEKAWDTL